MLTGNYKLKFTACQSIDDIIKYFNHLSYKAPKKVAILEQIFAYTNWFNIVEPAQETIGYEVKATRPYVCNTTTEFEEEEILVKFYRHRHTSVYEINPIFNNYELRKRLQHIFKCFRWLPKVLLLSVSVSEYFKNKKENTFKSADITPTKEKKYNQKKTAPSTGREILINDETTVESSQILYKNTHTTQGEPQRTRKRNRKNFKIIQPHLQAQLAMQETRNNLEKLAYLNSQTPHSLWCAVVDKQLEEREVLKKLKSELNLGDYEISELGAFDDMVLKEAYRVLCAKANVSNKFHFLRGVCRKIVERAAPAVAAPKEPKEYPIIKPKENILYSLTWDQRIEMMEHARSKQNNIQLNKHMLDEINKLKDLKENSGMSFGEWYKLHIIDVAAAQTKWDSQPKHIDEVMRQIKLNSPTLPELISDNKTDSSDAITIELQEIAAKAQQLMEWQKKYPQFADDPTITAQADKYAKRIEELLRS